MTQDTFRIGTRGSPLALVQAGKVAKILESAHPGIKTDIVPIRTSGDWKPEHGEKPLSDKEGGKGQFVKEIEKALLENAIDCGVHSLKDVPSFLPEGLVVEHVLPREDPRDAFLSNTVRTLDELPQGARVGTTSMRRQSFILQRRPDLKIETLRGNVQTRIDKLRAGQVDATILALAGLRRLGLENEAASTMQPDVMLPACGQGIIGMEIRAKDVRSRALLDKIHCRDTGFCAMAERAVLQVINGSCHTPIAAYAILNGKTMRLRALLALPDGTTIWREEETFAVTSNAEAVRAGEQVGYRLKTAVPADAMARIIA